MSIASRQIRRGTKLTSPPHLGDGQIHPLFSNGIGANDDQGAGRRADDLRRSDGCRAEHFLLREASSEQVTVWGWIGHPCRSTTRSGRVGEGVQNSRAAHLRRECVAFIAVCCILSNEGSLLS